MSVVRTSDMTVVSQINSGPVYIGLQVKSIVGGYTLYASGGPSNSVKTFSITGGGTISAGPAIGVSPILPKNAGYVSNYASGATATFVNSAGTDVASITNPGFPASSAITFPRGFRA